MPVGLAAAGWWVRSSDRRRASHGVRSLHSPTCRRRCVARRDASERRRAARGTLFVNSSARCSTESVPTGSFCRGALEARMVMQHANRACVGARSEARRRARSARWRTDTCGPRRPAAAEHPPAHGRARRARGGTARQRPSVPARTWPGARSSSFRRPGTRRARTLRRHEQRSSPGACTRGQHAARRASAALAAGGAKAPSRGVSWVSVGCDWCHQRQRGALPRARPARTHRCRCSSARARTGRQSAQ
jgi:hypothetical protein